MLSQSILEQMYLSDTKLLTNWEDWVWILTSAVWNHWWDEHWTPKVYAPYIRTHDTLSWLVNDLEDRWDRKKYSVTTIEQEEYQELLFDGKLV